jgi:hypothetical protein
MNSESDRFERIRGRAYELWERDGRPDGHEWDHWLDAERDIAAEEREASVRDASAGGNTGITNHPVEEEREEQRELPPRGEARRVAGGAS